MVNKLMNFWTLKASRNVTGPQNRFFWVWNLWNLKIRFQVLKILKNILNLQRPRMHSHGQLLVHRHAAAHHKHHHRQPRRRHRHHLSLNNWSFSRRKDPCKSIDATAGHSPLVKKSAESHMFEAWCGTAIDQPALLYHVGTYRKCNNSDTAFIQYDLFY